MNPRKQAPWRKCLRHVEKKVGRIQRVQWCCILECGHTVSGRAPDPPHKRRRCWPCLEMGTEVATP